MVATVGSSLSHFANPRLLLALAAIFGIMAAQAGRGTLAFFTSVATSSGNTFTAGTVSLFLTDGVVADTQTLNAQFTANNTTWKPGAFVTAPITVKSTGTLGLTYGLSYTASNNALTPLMTVTVKSGVTTCTTAGFGSSGTSVLTATTLSTSGATLLADTSRTLSAAANEILCFQFAFADGGAPTTNTNGDNAAQGLANTVVLSFNGRQ